jgi:hypothetical protein
MSTERMTRNQEMFRHANERLRERVIGAGKTDHRHIPFFCECGDDNCSGRINATLDEFDDAHTASDLFFILPGHLRIASAESIEDNGRYEVVGKP